MSRVVKIVNALYLLLDPLTFDEKNRLLKTSARVNICANNKAVVVITTEAVNHRRIVAGSSKLVGVFPSHLHEDPR